MPRQKIWMGCSLVLALGFLLIVAKTLQKKARAKTRTSLAALKQKQSAKKKSAPKKRAPKAK